MVNDIGKVEARGKVNSEMESSDPEMYHFVNLEKRDKYKSGLKTQRSVDCNHDFPPLYECYYCRSMSLTGTAVTWWGEGGGMPSIFFQPRSSVFGY